MLERCYYSRSPTALRSSRWSAKEALRLMNGVALRGHWISENRALGAANDLLGNRTEGNVTPPRVSMGGNHNHVRPLVLRNPHNLTCCIAVTDDSPYTYSLRLNRSGQLAQILRGIGMERSLVLRNLQDPVRIIGQGWHHRHHIHQHKLRSEMCGQLTSVLNRGRCSLAEIRGANDLLSWNHDNPLCYLLHDYKLLKSARCRFMLVPFRVVMSAVLAPRLSPLLPIAQIASFDEP